MGIESVKTNKELPLRGDFLGISGDINSSYRERFYWRVPEHQIAKSLNIKS
jgi:hypothetical protein